MRRPFKDQSSAEATLFALAAVLNDGEQYGRQFVQAVDKAVDEALTRGAPGVTLTIESWLSLKEPVLGVRRMGGMDDNYEFAGQYAWSLLVKLVNSCLETAGFPHIKAVVHDASGRVPRLVVSGTFSADGEISFPTLWLRGSVTVSCG